jgi:hypothetical protein
MRVYGVSNRICRFSIFGGGVMNTFIIGCSATKLCERMPAMELYNGPLWQTWRKYNNGQQCYAISAKYGLIPATESIDPYDCLLGREVTPQQLFDLVCTQLPDFGTNNIYVAASAKYADVLRRCGIDFTFMGGGIGYKRQQLKNILTSEV